MFESLGLNIDYVLLGVGSLTLILFISVIALIISQHKLKKKYNKFMEGSNGKTLEEQFTKKFEEVDVITEENKKIKIVLKKMKDNLKITYQKMGIVKYDAFHDMGGKLSFAVALLNEENSGVILNSMHSPREGCYVYIKEIIRGESYLVLSEEEKLALKEAIDNQVK